MNICSHWHPQNRTNLFSYILFQHLYENMNVAFCYMLLCYGFLYCHKKMRACVWIKWIQDTFPYWEQEKIILTKRKKKLFTYKEWAFTFFASTIMERENFSFVVSLYEKFRLFSFVAHSLKYNFIVFLFMSVSVPFASNVRKKKFKTPSN